MTNLMPQNLMDQVAAIDDLTKFATRMIRLDETTGLYITEDRVTGEVGQYETYREARTSASF